MVDGMSAAYPRAHGVGDRFGRLAQVALIREAGSHRFRDAVRGEYQACSRAQRLRQSVARIDHVFGVRVDEAWIRMPVADVHDLDASEPFLSKRLARGFDVLA